MPAFGFHASHEQFPLGELLQDVHAAEHAGHTRQPFDRMAGRASALALFPEEMDATAGAFLGNFLQGLSHLAFVTSALYLARAEGTDVPLVPRSPHVDWETA